VQHPTKIIAAPVNYRAHVAEANADAGIRYGHTQTDIGEAGLFLKANSSLAGPGAGIPLRFPERRTDHEVELVVVIGQAGSDIPRHQALGHVAGYAVGLDITLRGPEDRSFRKSPDGYSVVGPYLVTADEVPDPAALSLSLDLNGERRQHASTADMVYGVERLIEFASSFYTLHPGDLLFTGTPEGVGPIRPGDELVATVEGVGRLTTRARAHTAQPRQTPA
jgi:2-keto-4-pentenoate hydratase/2-oxohepta-3-ene-1,7-dioic acid hydratase in catechol pathway